MVNPLNSDEPMRELMADAVAELTPPDDVVRAVQAMNGNCSRETALQIIERDVRDLTALRYDQRNDALRGLFKGRGPV